jgi:hypothetical protein
MLRQKQDARFVSLCEMPSSAAGTAPAVWTQTIAVIAMFFSCICSLSAFLHAAETPQPMKFDWVREGPADACKGHCREWISATGAVTEATPKEFVDFAKARDVRGSTIVLDSPGGHVLAAIWLGREFRRLGLATTVGKTELLAANSPAPRRASLQSRGQCQSICPFLLLGGVLRHVPADARILVHQIWPAGKRDDAMATTYSALQLVGAERQLGQLARYTIEMGGDIALFELAMRSPPWELLRPLTADEVRRAGLNNVEDAFDKVALESVTGSGGPPLDFFATAATGDLKSSSWEIVERGGVPVLTRQYPLTVHGAEIGNFQISITCSENESYNIAYSETRQIAENDALRVMHVAVGVGRQGIRLNVGSSLRDMQNAKIESIATGNAPVLFIAELMRDGGQPLAVVTTDSIGAKTTVIIGKAGLSPSIDKFAAMCKH